MKKILFVHHSSEIGGGSYCLLNLLKELDRDSYVPIVLLKSQGPLAEDISSLGVKVRFLPSLDAVPYNRSLLNPRTVQAYRRALVSLADFKEVLDDIRPDIVYLNNSMLYPYLKVGKGMGIKTVIHIREHWPSEEHRIQLRWFRKGISEYADRIIAINGYSASMVPGCEEKKAIVYDWIDFADRNAYQDMNELMNEDVSSKKIYLYTGGMQSIKGACEVMETFTKVCGDDCRLLALGTYLPKFDGLRGRIKLLLKKFGYRVPSVRIYDAMIRDKRIVGVPATYSIKSIIQQSHCVLSYFTIPHANLVLAESIILKTPVIAVRTSESEEYSLNGELAVLIPFGDICAFEAAVKMADESIPSLKTKLDSRSFMIAEQFDRTTNAQVFNRVLSEL